MIDVPVFDRDALINELKTFDFGGIPPSLSFCMIEVVKSRIAMLEGQPDTPHNDTYVGYMIFFEVMDRLLPTIKVAPHIRLKILRLRKLLVRVTVRDFPEADRLEMYFEEAERIARSD